jgi:hypothetical protein
VTQFTEILPIKQRRTWLPALSCVGAFIPAPAGRLVGRLSGNIMLLWERREFGTVKESLVSGVGFLICS